MNLHLVLECQQQTLTTLFDAYFAQRVQQVLPMPSPRIVCALDGLVRVKTPEWPGQQIFGCFVASSLEIPTLLLRTYNFE